MATGTHTWQVWVPLTALMIGTLGLLGCDRQPLQLRRAQAADAPSGSGRTSRFFAAADPAAGAKDAGGNAAGGNAAGGNAPGGNAPGGNAPGANPAPRGAVFPAASWFNGQPLTAADLDGKIVLVDFWCYTCVNCIRTLPYVQEWHRRYAKHGVVIVGVHAPEFEFEKTDQHVRDAVKRFGLTYPIVMDNDRQIWDAFSNNAWPAKYIFDNGRQLLNRQGQLDGAETRACYNQVGEGEYRATEQLIQDLLKARGVKAEDLPPLMKPITPLDALEETRRLVCYPVTREIYTGFRGIRLGQWGSDVELAATKEYRSYEVPERPVEGRAYLRGTWQVTEEYTRHPRSSAANEDFLLIRYKAVEVNAVIHLHQHDGKTPVLVPVTLDGSALPREKAGPDVVFDESGASFVKVLEPRMYGIVKSPVFGEHNLAFWPRDAAFAVYAFTFGSCLKPEAKLLTGPPKP